MTRAFSIYLDVVRFAAACLVYLYHSNQRWLIEEKLPFSSYGHSAVVVFFVLSGYVIAYVADTKERNWVSYSASRIARVFSVVVPAIVLCLAWDWIGRAQALGNYDYPYDQFLVRIAASLLMLNEIWGVSITSFSNVPYWSITFEFWYYLLFALVTFVPGRKGWWLATVVLVLLGPKIALLAPLWCAGVVLYRWRALQSMSMAMGWALFVVSTVAIVWAHGSGLLDGMTEWLKNAVGTGLHTQMTFAKFFVGDYLLGILVFINFVGMRSAAPSLEPWVLRLEAPIRWMAGYTFTLYLLHQPLFLFWGSVLKGDPKTPWAWWAVTALSALSIVAVGYLTENKRGHLKLWVQRALAWLAAKHPAGVVNA